MDDESEPGTTKTAPIPAVDGETTVEMDRFRLLQRVQQDMQSVDGDTMRLSVEDLIDAEEMKQTTQLKAVTEDTRADPTPASRETNLNQFKTLQIELIPVTSGETSTKPSSTKPALAKPSSITFEFEATIQPGGLITVPAEFFGKNGARVGMRLRISAKPT